ELLQRADGVRHLGAVRRRELDQLLAVDVALLLQTDVAVVGDENLDVRLTFDAHTRGLLKDHHPARTAPRCPASRAEEPDRRRPSADRRIGSAPLAGVA